MASRRIGLGAPKPREDHGNHEDVSRKEQILPLSRNQSTRRTRSLLRRPVIFLGVVTLTLVLTMTSIVVKLESTLENSRNELRRGGAPAFGKHPSSHSVQSPSSARNNRQQPDNSDASDTQKLTKKNQKKKAGKESGNTTANSDKDLLEIYKTFDDPPVMQAPIIVDGIQDFDPSLPGVVVVTKIQGPPHLRALRQMLCLFTKAYNDRSQRDIIVFTSEKIDDKDIQELQQLATPAKMSMIIDNPGLDKMVQALPKEQQAHLAERCHVSDASQLTWYSECDEVRSYSTLKNERLAYNWQAEFRALHIWTHDALKPYKYMMWLDSDAFCTRKWQQDPLAAAVRHDTALLFDHFPQGKARGSEFPAITREAFNRTICGVQLLNGTLHARDGRCFGKKKSSIHQVHGFFHITNLDFYRSEPVMRWNKALIGDNHFSRLFDDQIGVTIPAAVLAPDRSWDMKSLGIYPRVFHNYVIDGLMQDWRGYFVP